MENNNNNLNEENTAFTPQENYSPVQAEQQQQQPISQPIQKSQVQQETQPKENVNYNQNGNYAYNPYYNASHTADNTATASGSKSDYKKIIVTVSVVVIFAIVFIIVLAVNLGSVNADDYILDEITFSGYNGYATVETSTDELVDYESIYADMEIENDEIEETALWIGSKYVIANYIEIDVEDGSTKNLSNGDTVTYTITINYDDLNKLDPKKKLKGKDVITKEYKVSGLDDAVEIDPFEAVTKVIVDQSYDSWTDTYSYDASLKFADTIGEYRITDSSNSYSTYYEFDTGVYDEMWEENKTATVNFNVPDIVSISDGEEITVSLSTSYDSYAGYGIVFTETSKTYPVYLAQYVSDSSQINEDMYNTARQLFDEEAQSNSGEYTLEGIYFYREEDTYWNDTDIKLMALYKYQSNAVGSTAEYVYYSMYAPKILSDEDYIFSDTTVSGSYGDYETLAELEDELAASTDYVTVTNFDKLSF